MIPNQITYCLIWGKDYRATGDPNPRNSTSFVISDRTGGAYRITEEALELIEERDGHWKALLTTWLVDQRAQGDKQPWVTTGVVEHIDGRRPLPVHERAEMLLKYLVGKSNNIGETIEIGCEGKRNSYNEWEAFSDSPTEQNVMAWTESTSDQQIQFLTKYLVKQGWVEAEFYGRCSHCTVLVDGYEHIADQNTNRSTIQGLVTDMKDKQVREDDYDFFIAHASEDKEGFVRKLAETLRTKGAKVWYDEFTLKVGDSFRREIERGLASSRFGIVVLSKHFFEKEWPKQELDGLWSLDLGGVIRILPIWHEISREEVALHSPMLADRFALSTSLKSTDEIADELCNRLG